MIETARDGRVFQIALNRPEKRNALNIELCRNLLAAFEEAERDLSINTILLSANGPAFCAGMDLQEVLNAPPPGMAEVHEDLFTMVNRIRKPVVAAVHGPALAGGTGLAANAHIVIASSDARFGLTEIRLGLWPVLVFRAVALAIGERRATELSLTGRTFEAEEALRYGLVTQIAEDPLKRARELAQTVSAYSSAALAEGLGYIQQIRGMGWDQAGSLGQAMRERLMTSLEFKEGIRAFLEKR